VEEKHKKQEGLRRGTQRQNATAQQGGIRGHPKEGQSHRKRERKKTKKNFRKKEEEKYTKKVDDT